MPTLCLPILLFASAVTAEERLEKPPPHVNPSLRQHFERGGRLEEIGFFEEAETEYLAALRVASGASRISVSEALQRIRDAQRKISSTEADRRSNVHFKLGEELFGQGQYTEALAAFERAYNEANSLEVRAQAQAAIVRVLQEKNSFWQGLYEDWLLPAWKAFIILVASVAVILPLRLLIYRLLASVGHFLARFSKRIEIADFEDMTQTGFGKGFPALIRSIYQYRQQLPIMHQGSELVTYTRPGQTGQPVMGSRKYEDFSEIKLDIAGVSVPELLGKITRLLWPPRYSISGAVYQDNDATRVFASLAKHNGTIEYWDLALSDNRTGGAMAFDAAYRIINAIIRDWERH
jgi:tetratricopeptide (TPR) repeat protein